MATSDDSHGKRADQVDVTKFRQILVWPLALEHKALGAASGFLAAVPTKWKTAAETAAEVSRELVHIYDNASAEQRPGLWRQQPDPLRHVMRHNGQPLGDEIGPDAYAEFVYFHPYVQNFLYQRQSEKASGSEAAQFQLFQRDDLRRVVVDICLVENQSPRVARYDLAIDRLNLYVFNCGVAILALEVVGDGFKVLEHENASEPMRSGLRLDDVLRFQNAFRRCYAPYWIPIDGKLVPAEVPQRVTFSDSDGRALINFSYGADDAPKELKKLDADAHRRPPVFAHWHQLMPLAIAGQDATGKVQKAAWRHIVDERIPSLAYVSLGDDASQLSKLELGELIRLCFVDTPGVNPYPYDKSFLANFEAENCYDRFHSMGTRHVFAGYSYVAVGAGDEFNRFIESHFRRHYFQMALLSHLEVAALLTYSNWTSEAVARCRGKLREPGFASIIQYIQEELLAFVHQYRFLGLSNQLQPTEMQAYWRKHLRLNELFDEVSLETKTATQYLFAKDQTQQARAGSALAIIATIATALGLPMAFVGPSFDPAQYLAAAMWVNGVALLSSLILGGSYRALFGGDARKVRSVLEDTNLFLLTAFLVAAALAAALHFSAGGP